MNEAVTAGEIAHIFIGEISRAIANDHPCFRQSCLVHYGLQRPANVTFFILGSSHEDVGTALHRHGLCTAVANDGVSMNSSEISRQSLNLTRLKVAELLPLMGN